MVDSVDSVSRVANSYFVCSSQRRVRSGWACKRFYSVQDNRYDGAVSDLRFAWRTFRKAPGPTLLAVIALALGIGANTAIFSVVRAVLLKPLPYASPDRLVALFESNATTGTARVDTALANYETWRDHTRSFENVAAWRTGYRRSQARATPSNSWPDT